MKTQKEVKTEFDYGFEYAKFMVENGEVEQEEVDVNGMITGSVDIPEGDYLEMVNEGIENPDAHEYWRGYNSYIEQN